jgi:Co/Zn/Cd efflux system component
MGAGQGSAVTTGLRRVVWLVALLNLAYFGVEFAVAVAIRSVSLFADSIDFLEDASINLLILAALGWTAPHRARVGMVLAGILLVPSLATLWTVWQQLAAPVLPEPVPLSLARYRRHPGSLIRAAFLSARNDAVANVAIVSTGLVTAYLRSVWPDLIVGLGICLMNADAAKKVYVAAREEHRAAVP